jgi:hypothetical protein
VKFVESNAQTSAGEVYRIDDQFIEILPITDVPNARVRAILSKVRMLVGVRYLSTGVKDVVVVTRLTFLQPLEHLVAAASGYNQDAG